MQVPLWLKRGVMRWRKDRWAFTPRLFPGKARTRVKRRCGHLWGELAQLTVRDIELEAGMSEEQHEKRQQLAALHRVRKWMHDPFVDCHRLACCLNTPYRPDREFYTCHWACVHTTPQLRARCLQPGHLGRFSAKQNSEHARLHGLGQTPAAPPP